MFGIDDIFSGLIGFAVQDMLNQNQFQDQLSMQMYQNNWNAEQAQIAREWDKPVNQMKRYQEAGINPAMAAQAITGSAPASSPVANSGTAPQVAKPTLGEIANFMLAAHEVENKDADTRGKELQNNWVDRLNDAKVKETLQSIKESISRENLNDEQKNYYNTTANEMVRMNDQQLINLRKDVDHKIAAINLINAQVINTDKASKVLDKEIEVKDTQIASLESGIAKNESDIARNETLNEVSTADIAQKLAAAGLDKAATLLKTAEFNLTNAEARKTLAEAIIIELKSELAEMGMFVDSSFLNNFVTVPANKGNLKEFLKPITDFLEFISNTAQKIETSIVDMNASFNANIEKAKANTGSNIYGNPWNSGRPIYNPDVRK